MCIVEIMIHEASKKFWQHYIMVELAVMLGDRALFEHHLDMMEYYDLILDLLGA